MKVQDSVGSPDEFLQTLITCGGCCFISTTCAFIAWMKERVIPLNDRSRGRFGVPGSALFHIMWRFAVICCLLEMILASFAIGLEFSWDTTDKSWLPMGLLNSQNDIFFMSTIHNAFKLITLSNSGLSCPLDLMVFLRNHAEAKTSSKIFHRK